MNHKLRIRVSDKPEPDSIVACRKTRARKRLLRKLLGSTEKVTVIVPGRTVESIAISEVKEGGDDKNRDK